MIREYLNINSHFDYYLIGHQNHKRLSLDELATVLPPTLARLELSRQKELPIPEPVLERYSTYRPTPLHRAEGFEQAIGTSCRIYVKDEGQTPSGNHKANSACLIANSCQVDGITTITTETTGNWGVALARAASEFGLKTMCFMDAESHRVRPDRMGRMEQCGAEVVVVEPDSEHGDLLTLSADSAIEYTRSLPGAAYVFGSVYGYFVLPQTVIGLEAREQLADLEDYPDIVVGSCGGGANILGTAAAYLADRLERGTSTRFVSAEAVACPILSQGQWGHHSIAQTQNFPRAWTYGLEGLVKDQAYVGGLGSTIVAPAVAEFHSRGLIEAMTLDAAEAGAAARLFHASEGRRVALETGYQLGAVIRAAKTERNKAILVNISSASAFPAGSC